MYSLNGKVVLITGASEGIGAELAEILGRRGASLSLVARRENKLNEVLGRTLSGTSRERGLITAGDITDAAVRREAVNRTVERFGRVDVLINNAGRGLYFRASNTPMDEARRLMELNFFAPLELSQLATPFLRESHGSIVNVSSIAGQISLPWLPVYSASKFALGSISASQRMELKRSGVHVMCVFPGYVHTAFQKNAGGPMPPHLVVESKQRFAVTASECAEAIVSGIEHRRNTVVTPKIGWALVWLYRFFPTLVESRMEMI